MLFVSMSKSTHETASSQETTTQIPEFRKHKSASTSIRVIVFFCHISVQWKQLSDKQKCRSRNLDNFPFQEGKLLQGDLDLSDTHTQG